MKNIKRKIIKAFAVLPAILCLLFVTGCKDELAIKEKIKPTAPQGKGFFVLSLGDANGRTIMPVFISGQDEPLYKLVFTNLDYEEDDNHAAGYNPDNAVTSEKVNQYQIEILDSEHIKLPIGLDIGRWTLELLYFINHTQLTANRPAASGRFQDENGNLKVIVIENQGRAKGDVTLFVFGTDEGEGIFIFDIKYPGDVEIDMVIQPLPDNPSVVIPVFDFTDGVVGLPSGFYRVIFTLTKDNTYTVTWRQSLHIYKNMESIYKYEFTDDHFIKISYTVTFISDGKDYEVTSYFFDENVVKPEVEPELSGHQFRGWFADAACTIPYEGFDEPLSADTFVYAKFLPVLAADVHIGIPVNTPPSGADLGNIIVPTIPNTNAYAPYNYQWKIKYKEDGEEKVYFIPANLGGEDHDLLVTMELVAFSAKDGYIFLTISHEFFYGEVDSALPAGGIKINDALGSVTNPFRVSTAGMLGRVGSNTPDPINTLAIWSSSANYVQTEHITAPAWTPIANFTGSYNGGGFEIRNLSINSSAADNRALFASIGTYGGASGRVENVILTNSSVTGRDNTGAIAAINYGTIQNVVVNNTTVQGADNSGGIAGQNFGTIRNSYSTGNVLSSGENAGGIAGLNNGAIDFCYSTITVTGNNYAGGIAGKNDASITNSIALNPNVTSRVGSQIGRVAGSGTSSGNKARSDLLPKIRNQDDQGLELTGDGDNGDITVNLNTALSSVFAGWSGWTIPGSNLAIGQQLPRLTQSAAFTSQNPAPTLPQPRLRDGADNAQISAFNIADFIKFNPQGGDRGWFLRPISGEWLLGGMIEGAESGVVELPGAINAAVNLQNAHNISAIAPTQIGNIGTLSLTTSGNGNGKIFNWLFVFSMPIKDATFKISYSSNPVRSYEYKPVGNVISFRHVAGTDFPTGGINAAIELSIETLGNWIYIPPEETPEPFIIFRSRIATGSDEYVYYFREDGVNPATGKGQATYGPVDFYTGTQCSAGSNRCYSNGTDGNVSCTRHFNVPTRAEVEAAGYLLSQQIFVAATSNDPQWGISNTAAIAAGTWLVESNGPHVSNVLPNYTSPQEANNPANAINNESRTSQVITLTTGEVVGTANIVLFDAATQASGSAYVFSANSNVDVDITLSLLPEFSSFIDKIEVFRGTTNPTMLAEMAAGVRTFRLRQTIGGSANANCNFAAFTVRFVYVE